MIDLPLPRSPRWQPLRSGLINIYRYDQQEFWFENGRLLLRGNNGTGKSRVLALQLPFLLDGETAPHRLEPDGDEAKRIEWNLLMGRHSDRLGYTWIEFGRHDGEHPHYVTLGCGLYAVEGRGLVNRWFFVTRQRVGESLFLLNATSAPLTRERLVEAVGGEGQVFTTARDYRRAVDAALFHLGEERYEALMDLLIQLRQPQLSRKLDEQKLTRALAQALPRIKDAILGDVAESFRNLEVDRHALDDLQAAGQAVKTFLAQYQRYTRMAVRRSAHAVCAADNAHAQRQRRQRELDQQLGQTRENQALELARSEQLGGDIEAARESVATLEQSPEMRDARALDEARRQSQECQESRDRALAESERSHERLERARHGHEQVREQRTQCEKDVRDVLDRVRAHLPHAALQPEELSGWDDLASDRLPLALDERLKRRTRDLEHLKKRNRDTEEARNRSAEARRGQASLEGQLNEARASQREAAQARSEAQELLVERFLDWAGSVRELRLVDIEAVASLLVQWGDAGLSGPSPLDHARRAAEAESAARLSALKVDLEGRTREAQATHASLCAQRDDLLARGYMPPPAPRTRAPEVRDMRAGAPLYLLCDFASHLEAAERAGLEAALESSGLLDAWVCPDGRVLPAGEGDTAIAVGVSPPAPADRSLARVLVPVVDDEPQHAVSRATVLAVLEHVGYGRGAGVTWVSTDGNWQMGPLHGWWSKPEAQHVGQATRELARQHHLRQLAEEIARVEQELAALEQQRATLRARQQALQDEVRRVPDESDLRRAQAEVEAIDRQVNLLRRRVAEAQRAALEKQAEFEQAQRRRDGDARDLGLFDRVDRLEELAEGITACRVAAARLPASLSGWRYASSNEERAAAEIERCQSGFDEGQARVRDAESRARQALARLEELEATVGAAVAEIMARLEAAREKERALRVQTRQIQQRLAELQREVYRLEAQVEAAAEEFRRATAERAEALQGLVRLVQARLIAEAAPGVRLEGEPSTWSVTRAVEIARDLDSRLAEAPLDLPAWERVARKIFEHFETLKSGLLPYDYRPEAILEGDVLVVAVPYQGRPLTVGELQSELLQEIEMRQSVLNAREREVLENHLMGEVSAHLGELLHKAEDWVRKMNVELESRPTSTGMRLRFRWQPAADAPAGLGEARQRLMRVRETWSPADRQLVGEFLQRQIQAARAASEGGWQHHLAIALDYRTWHEFVIERCQDNQWKRLTRRTHGTGSGGEKVITLTIPQFAAASAYYSGADPTALRLILLDEAFVGVDQDMRAKCMGLLETFDLDFVMTSEREWACYQTLSGVAIYHLSSRPGIDAVGLSRWVWNGDARVRADVTPPSAAPPMDEEPDGELMLFQ